MVKIFKKFELITRTEYNRKVYYNVIDVDVASGKYVGFYTVDKGGYETTLDGYSLLSLQEHHFSLREYDELMVRCSV